ncbi:MAG TPA: 16S rRNA (adenine(1518)-N(6)/adenine(1519)-N(6))-dimethyltransferase RsmA [Bdellovibrionota bacterium]|nr:16S rRNA (adenine(1518)-N(6)/adenine(1519)-N(6))-dimethyltransferase RsmA [Bdellovibrionota bacterium]
MPAYGKRRALGQHFLKDQAICRLITSTLIDEARKTGCKSILEIGPGRGALTSMILNSEYVSEFDEIVLCERDRELAAIWRNQNIQALFRVEEGDFLDLPEDRWLTTEPIAVGSNLPYSAGTAILLRLAEHWRSIPVMVLMFQAEVARRLRAEPGSKSWGSLSLWIQNIWTVEKLSAVPARAFAPPPDVESEVVILKPRDLPRIPDAASTEGAPLWRTLLKAAFSHRRKMLRSGLPSGVLRNALDRSPVDGTKRAEQLNWEEWDSLYQTFRKISTNA